MAVVIKIVDTMFAHNKGATTIVPWDEQEIIWDRNVSHNDEIVFYTDKFESPEFGKKKIALLIESPEVTPDLYNKIKTYYKNFDYVFTFEKELLSTLPNAIQYNLGGCWIKKENISLNKKSKMLSMISSAKRGKHGYSLRHEIAQRYRNKIDLLCGRGYQPIQFKDDALKDFRYFIIIENCQRDYYFTEKIVDCICTGTVPIYWGCPSIGNYFNSKGIITFSNQNDIKNILDSLSEQDYNSRISYLQENLELSKNYFICENNILIKLKNLYSEIL